MLFKQKKNNIINSIKIMTIFNIKYKYSLIFNRSFFSKKLRPDERIGPHNRDVLSIIIGSLLGNAYMEKRKNGTRIIFELCNGNVQYILWLHKFFVSKGYCSYKKKKIKKFFLFNKVNKNNKLFKYSFKTYTFTSFNWLYDMFYKDRIKTIYINQYLIPLILYAWFLNYGENKKVVFKISIKNLKSLSYLITNDFKLNTTISLTNKSGVFSIKFYINPVVTLLRCYVVTKKKIKSQTLPPYKINNKYKLDLSNNTFTYPNINNKFYLNIRQYSTNQ